MPLMTKELFEELAKSASPYNVSIYVPTQIIGENQEGRILLKNQIKEVRRELVGRGMSENEAENYLKPVYGLFDDITIWRHLSLGMAIFINDKMFKYTTLPINFKAFWYVGNNFHLLPMLPIFNDEGKFFILSLSINNTRLFEGTSDYIVQIAIDDVIPVTMLDVVGYDVQEKATQFRSQQSDRGRAMYHGHGAGKDDKKLEIEKYLRSIDKIIVSLLKGYNAPIVVASVDYIFDMYKEISNYPSLIEKNLSGNPEGLHMNELHKQAKDLLADYYLKDKEEKKEKYENSNERATSVIEDIVLAAKEGNIDTLFVRKNSNIWGKYDEKDHKIELFDERNHDSKCLLDISAKSTFLQGGNVYILEPEELPEKESAANAILRY